MFSLFQFYLSRRALLAALVLVLARRDAFSQQQDTTRRKMPMPMPKPSADSEKKSPSKHDTTSMAMPDTGTAMMMSEPLGVSMNRMGSGTTWIPDAVSL